MKFSLKGSNIVDMSVALKVVNGLLFDLERSKIIISEDDTVNSAKENKCESNLANEL